ncbi:MAG: hypothetical protein D3920_14450 [Candidatus Electrothrix sp. AW2]|nr:hypothetical protein [Candidatus Electrothrix gigas]MCI5191580.1 hypothetical protein [Candidatus Electrothrix gigas]MCI5197280.1 hypothetical protein [Candidatus Electrothrix gigas]
MLKNITLSADERLIFKARKKAQSEHTTLNARFRQWLDRYTASNIDKEYSSLMDQLSYAKPSGRYSRDELNER